MAGGGNCWARERNVSSRRLDPFRFISTPPPRFSTSSFNPFSLEIKVSSCLRTSCRFLHSWPIIPYVYYKIILLHSLLRHDVLISQRISWCPLPLLWNDNTDTLWKWLFFAVKKCTSFTTYSASCSLGFKPGPGLHWLRAWNWPPGLETHLEH